MTPLWLWRLRLTNWKFFRSWLFSAPPVRYYFEVKWKIGVRLHWLIVHPFTTRFPGAVHLYVRATRALLCRPFGHQWGRFEVEKFAGGGVSRTCRACGMHHSHRLMNNGGSMHLNTYNDTHLPQGWRSVALDGTPL